jgi:hypothetical protein
MKATSSSHSEVKCENGRHHPDATHIKAHCFELFPEQKEKMLKRRAQAKAKKASAAHEEQAADSGIAWHTVNKAHLAKLPANMAYLDSGASHHMIADRRFFATYLTESTCKIKLADGQMTVSPGSGYVYVKTETGEHLKLECLHIPGLVGNLISQGRLYC